MHLSYVNCSVLQFKLCSQFGAVRETKSVLHQHPTATSIMLGIPAEHPVFSNRSNTKLARIVGIEHQTYPQGRYQAHNNGSLNLPSQ